MTLLGHYYDIELLQMTLKTIFQNINLDEKVYIDQEGFLVEENKHIVCKLNKSIYILKQAFKQQYLKFNDTIYSFRFKKNTINQDIYLKVNESMFMFRILCIDDIQLETNDLGLLHENKKFSLIILI